MAKIIPERTIDFNSSYGEKQVFEALKKLPDDYIVFYSVAWKQLERKLNIIKYGESDFTIFHPQKGIIVIEVKSGGISYHDRMLVAN